MIVGLLLLKLYNNVTNRRTDRQTDILQFLTELTRGKKQIRQKHCNIKDIVSVA